MPTPLDILRDRLGEEWPAIYRAREVSEGQKCEVRSWLDNLDPADTSIVVFGSLARQEWTSGSDLDWTLLVDGEADPQHLQAAQRIGQTLQERVRGPGPTGLFGNMAFSHDIIHRIGGQDDTNRNITQRILLLVESWPAGKAEAYHRVIRHVLKRYVDDDWGLRHGSGPHRVPRFLLNDLVRYWRTVTVDFVYKQRERAGRGWALRNAKLRMSRKLIFAAGLLTCFSCDEPHLRQVQPDGIVGYLEASFGNTPLDVVADAFLRYGRTDHTARQLVGAYDSFLALLDNAEKRKHLEELQQHELDSDPVFGEVRTQGRRFQEALTRLFFQEDQKLGTLTMEYGVF